MTEGPNSPGNCKATATCTLVVLAFALVAWALPVFHAERFSFVTGKPESVTVWGYETKTGLRHGYFSPGLLAPVAVILCVPALITVLVRRNRLQSCLRNGEPPELAGHRGLVTDCRISAVLTFTASLLSLLQGGVGFLLKYGMPEDKTALLQTTVGEGAYSLLATGVALSLCGVLLLRTACRYRCGIQASDSGA